MCKCDYCGKDAERLISACNYVLMSVKVCEDCYDEFSEDNV
jgi:hypothetical protein